MILATFCLLSAIFLQISGSADFRDDGLTRENELRALHGAKQVKRHDKLDIAAQSYAEKLAREGNMTHSFGMEIDGVGWNENIWMTNAPGTPSQHVLNALDGWYSEIKFYNYSNPGWTPPAGHFTCMIWNDTMYHSYGVATNDTTRMTFVVATSMPPCNLGGEADIFQQNVFPLKKTKSVSQVKVRKVVKFWRVQFCRRWRSQNPHPNPSETPDSPVGRNRVPRMCRTLWKNLAQRSRPKDSTL